MDWLVTRSYICWIIYYYFYIVIFIYCLFIFKCWDANPRPLYYWVTVMASFLFLLRYSLFLMLTLNKLCIQGLELMNLLPQPSEYLRMQICAVIPEFNFCHNWKQTYSFHAMEEINWWKNDSLTFAKLQKLSYW